MKKLRSFKPSRNNHGIFKSKETLKKKTNNLDIIKHHFKKKNWTLHHLSDDWDLRSATRTLCGSNAHAAAHEHSCQVQRGGLVSLAFLWRVRGEA